MYRKKGRGWTKHIDFMLLDVLCMQIAFIVSYIWRFGPGNPYTDNDCSCFRTVNRVMKQEVFTPGGVNLCFSLSGIV